VTLSDADLLAYLDEALPEGRAVEVERAVRESGEIRQRLSVLLRQRDQGGHTLGEIWRRRQLSCVSRTDLSRYLSGQLPPGDRDYLEFHTGVIQCSVCLANLEDLRSLANAESTSQDARRKRIFESSAGGLRKP
jgi:anti-sigma factor RsiW